MPDHEPKPSAGKDDPGAPGKLSRREFISHLGGSSLTKHPDQRPKLAAAIVEDAARLAESYLRSDDVGVMMSWALLGRDGTEYVPQGKRDRSCQIFRFGFT